MQLSEKPYIFFFEFFAVFLKFISNLAHFEEGDLPHLAHFPNY